MYLQDIKVVDDDGTLLYEGPPFVRCEQYGCRKLVTQGQIEKDGACLCGGRKLAPAMALLPQEIEDLYAGLYPLVEWEQLFLKQELAHA